MLNHANILSVAKAPPEPKENVYLAFKGYSEKHMVDLKARGVELLQAFMADPAANRIQLSPGLTRVANGMGDEVSEASEEMAMAEGEFLEPMPLPGAVDSFDMEGEMFE